MREPTYEEQILILAAFVGSDSLSVERKKEMVEAFCRRFNVTTVRLEQDIIRMIKGE